jgi:pimeloyl-ACP methyl ester carboxylesterase
LTPAQEPRKGHIDSFAEYDRDLDAFMQQVALPDCPPPHFALAHSTGGLVALRAVHDGRVRFARMVIDGPLLGLGNRALAAPSRRGTAFMTASSRRNGSARAGSSSTWLTTTCCRATGPLRTEPEVSLKALAITVGVPTMAGSPPAGDAEVSDNRSRPGINTPILSSPIARQGGVGAAIEDWPRAPHRVLRARPRRAPRDPDGARQAPPSTGRRSTPSCRGQRSGLALGDHLFVWVAEAQTRPPPAAEPPSHAVIGRRP